MKELKVGETIQVGFETVKCEKVEEGETRFCWNCIFGEPDVYCGNLVNLLGECDAEKRTDGNKVIFKVMNNKEIKP